MARRADDPATSNWRDVAVLATMAVAVIVALVVITGMVASGGAPEVSQAPGTAVAGGTDTRAAAPSASSRGSASGAPTSTPRAGDASPGATADGIPTPVATPTPTPLVGRAPTSPDNFDLNNQIIPIEFPLLRQTRYKYRNNFLDVREGAPNSYNHAALRRDGSTVRLHDGIDIYAEEGEPLVAVFSGTVIDPSGLWRPWKPERYGRVIAIRSDEAETSGYVALYSHADRVWVQVGAEVRRGQVLGSVGRTGNAEVQSIHPHLHFELRAPFPLDWGSLGEERQVDAFNPYPSLRAADPKRR